MTHDLRTPLNGIDFMIENAKNEELSVEERNKFLDYAKSNSTLLMSLINDILDYS